MIGTTNITKIKPAQPHILKYDNLILWLDGTDLLNHGPTGDMMTINNTNNFNTIIISADQYNNQNVACYHKDSTVQDSMNIWPTAAFSPFSYTISVWGNRLSNDNYMNLTCLGQSNSAWVEIRLRETTNNSITFYVRTNGSYTNRPQAVGATLNTWHHYAISYSSGNYKMYFDGILKETYAMTPTLIDISTWRLLGGTNWNNAGGKAEAADYRVYNIPLSDEEITSIFNAGPQTHIGWR